MRLLFLTLTICLFCSSCRDEIDECSDFLDLECSKLEIGPYYNYHCWGDLYNNSTFSKLSISFYLRKKISLEESRRDLVYIHKTVLSKINLNVDLLRKFDLDLLKEDEFSVRVLFENLSLKDFSKEFYVASCSIKEGEVDYYMVNDMSETPFIYKESLEEAYRIVEEEAKSESST